MGFSIGNLFTFFSKFGRLSDEIKGEKDWYRSKTIWFNGLSLLAWVLSEFVNLNIGLDHEAATAIAGGTAAIINIALRIVTRHAITTQSGSGGSLK